ncbi:hypothetical protein BHE74_00039409 [Ensete ventricosum]|nr:hypothetical protein GW17_00043404 [Ensete ventricosum]RWW54037.1 hypothetical protein BHE74_00039409 [Ensete ventricosum]
MDNHGNTSEEATSTRGTRSAADLVSEVEVTGYDTAYSLSLCLSPELLTSPFREGNSGFSLTSASEGPHGVNPPIPEEACVQDHHPRDGPRDQSTDAQDEDN